MQAPDKISTAETSSGHTYLIHTQLEARNEHTVYWINILLNCGIQILEIQHTCTENNEQNLFFSHNFGSPEPFASRQYAVSKSGYLYLALESWKRLNGAGRSRTGVSSVPAWRRSQTSTVTIVQIKYPEGHTVSADPGATVKQNVDPVYYVFVPYCTWIEWFIWYCSLLTVYLSTGCYPAECCQECGSTGHEFPFFKKCNKYSQVQRNYLSELWKIYGMNLLTF